MCEENEPCDVELGIWLAELIDCCNGNSPLVREVRGVLLVGNIEGDGGRIGGDFIFTVSNWTLQILGRVSQGFEIRKGARDMTCTLRNGREHGRNTLNTHGLEIMYSGI